MAADCVSWTEATVCAALSSIELTTFSRSSSYAPTPITQSQGAKYAILVSFVRGAGSSAFFQG